MPRDEPAISWESARQQHWHGHTAADDGLCVTKQRFAEVNLQEAEDGPAKGRRHALARKVLAAPKPFWCSALHCIGAAVWPLCCCMYEQRGCTPL